MILQRLRRRRLAGQAIIIMVLSILVLTGLLAVAIDGGMIYLDKRRLQNAADAGALAGGDALETLPLRSYQAPHQAALNEIYHNLFPGTTVPTVPAGPAATYDAYGFSNTYQFHLVANVANTTWDTYQVVVTHAYNFFAAQALGFSASTCTINTVSTSNAICLQSNAKMWAGTYPFALIVLDDQNLNNENLLIQGGGQLILHDGGTKGGAFSNESMSGNGATGQISFDPCGQSGDLWAANESVGGNAWIPAHTKGYGLDTGVYPLCTVPLAPYPKSTVKIPFPKYPEPTACTAASCTVTTPLTASGGTYYLCPGTYTGTLSESSGGSTVILYPGIYRFTAPIAFSLTGGTLRGATSADGAPPAGAINCTGYTPPAATGDWGLIIELKPPDCTTAGFNISGQPTITLKPSPKYNNISFYIELNGPYSTFGCSSTTPAGTHEVNITGKANLNIYGAFYGPGDNMFFCGNGAGYGVGQVVAWTMQLCGNGSLDEHYNPAYLPYFRGLIQ